MISNENNTNNKNIQADDYTGRDKYSTVTYNVFLTDVKSTLLSQDAIKLIDDFMKKSDKKVKDTFTDKIVSMKENRIVNFSTEKILSSLGKIGIPIKVGISIIDYVISELIYKKNEIKKLTTNHIRQEIANAIYKIDNSQFTHKEIQNWGDYYVRRYGDPEQQIEIIMSDDKIENLSFKFIGETLLPEVMERIDSNIKFLENEIEISEKQKERMGNEIKDLLLSINIYRIHYESLLILVEELALQPPHPWFISEKSQEYIIKYNYDRFVLHKQSLLEVKLNNNLTNINFKIIIEEYLYHSCSTILSFYNLHIGCGINAPLNNLIGYLDKYIQKKCDLLLKYSNLDKIKQDLEKINITPLTFYKKIKNLKQNSLITKNHLTNKEIQNLWKQLSILNNFIFKIITPHIRKHIFNEIINKEHLTDKEFENILIELLKLFPFAKYRFINKRSLYVTHNIDEGFMHNIKPKIFITILKQNDTKNINRLKKEIENINYSLTNLVFIITKEKDKINFKTNDNIIPIPINIYVLLKIIVDYEKPLEGVVDYILKEI